MKTLRTKILIYFLLPVLFLELFLVGSFGWLMLNSFNKIIGDNVRINALRISAAVKELLVSGNQSRLPGLLADEKYRDSRIKYALVFDRQGQVLAAASQDSQLPAKINYIDTNIGSRSYSVNLGGLQILNVDEQLLIGSFASGYLRIGQDYSKLKKDFYNAMYLLAVVSLFFLLLIAVLAFYLSRSIIRPIEKLSINMKEYASGNLSVRSDLVTNDEIGILASDFNNLTESLVQTNESLSAEKKKLQIKVNELELWQKNTIDRELKMVELKEEIKRLKEERGG